MISLRGRIVPVYDVAARLGVVRKPGAEAKIVIVEAGTETAGVIVDGVEEVLTVSADQDADVPGADATLIDRSPGSDDRLIVLLPEHDLRRPGSGDRRLSHHSGWPSLPLRPGWSSPTTAR